MKTHSGRKAYRKYTRFAGLEQDKHMAFSRNELNSGVHGFYGGHGTFPFVYRRTVVSVPAVYPKKILETFLEMTVRINKTDEELSLRPFPFKAVSR
jgi:hypothetical protein